MRLKCSAIAMLILIVFILATKAFCQDHMTLHTDRSEWEDSIGLKFVTITSKDESLVYFYQVTKYERKISSLGYDKHTNFQKDDSKKPYTFTGCHVLHFCRKHLVIYIVQRVPCFDEDTRQLASSNPAKNPK
jgi:hypothetical protein